MRAVRASTPRFQRRSGFLFLALLNCGFQAARGQEHEKEGVVIGVEVPGRDCQGSWVGAPAGQVRIPVQVYAIVDENETDFLVQSWRFTVGIEGGQVVVGQEQCNRVCQAKLIFGNTADGEEIFFQAPVILDPRRVPIQGPLNGQRQGPGFYDSVILNITPNGAVILPHGKSAISRFYLEIAVPDSGEELIELIFKDGMEANTGALFTAVETAGMKFRPDQEKPDVISYTPDTIACGLRVRAGGRMMPGDASGSGALGLNDAILLLTQVVIGLTPALPCGDRSYKDPANLELLDSNGDGGLNVHDAIYLLSHIFLGTPPPVLGWACVPIAGCPDVCPE